MYGSGLLPPLIKCWAVLRTPAGRLLAPMLPILVPLLRRDQELATTDQQADLLMRMRAVTIDRKLTGERAKLMPGGGSHTKPGTLLKTQIPVRTWTEWDDTVPGFVEMIWSAAREATASGSPASPWRCRYLTAWTVYRSMREQSRQVRLPGP